MQFTGSIKAGKLLLDRKPDFDAHLHTLEGRRVEVSVEKFKRKRTPNQNAWYWGVVLKEISKETGDDPDSLHIAFKMKFSSHRTLHDLVVPESTKTKDTIEFSEYCERVRQWANEYLHLNIPDPNGTRADNTAANP
jgi:hypothetical protein